MTNTIKLNANDIINVHNNEITTTSLQVAEIFNKKHKNILQKIDEILTQVSDSFGKLNFKPTEYEIKNNIGATVKYRAFDITKDGFVLLVMGFTGRLAMQIKISYIEAFNFMAEKLYSQPLIADRLSTSDERVPLRQAVSKLVSAKGLLYPDAYNMVNNRMGTEHINEMTAAQAEKATDFVYYLMANDSIEGELMPRESETAPRLINDSKKGRMCGIALMHFGSLARLRQVDELRKLKKLVSQTQEQLENVMQYDGALHDGFAEAWLQLDFNGQESKDARVKAQEWFSKKFS